MVEAMVVIAVITAMAAVVLPRFVALQAGQASRDFASALVRLGSEARLMAIESGQAVHVRYDDQLRTVVFERVDPDSGQASEARSIPVPETVELTAFTIDGAFVSGSDWTLEFYPDGAGLDAGIEVEEGDYVYHVLIEGKDGTATKAIDRLEESGGQEWQAGELEQRI
jgi:type II secretory pathway pseudopilin PulG